MENTSEFYYKKLEKADNPGVVLATFYCILYGINVTRSEIILFNKLVKIYGRFIVFSSILDVTGSYSVRPEEPLPLFSTICKRRFEQLHQVDMTQQSRTSLDSYIDNLEKRKEELKNQKFKVPSSKGLESNG